MAGSARRSELEALKADRAGQYRIRVAAEETGREIERLPTRAAAAAGRKRRGA
jgi:hypothetical protein